MNELTGKRICIVEDDVTNMAVYAATLRKSGALVIQDFWNTDTLEAIRRQMPVDIILLDLMLRYQHSGYDVIRAIRQDPAMKHIPVIAVSAADPAVEIPRAQAEGFSAYIAKPIDPFELPVQILAVLKGESIWLASNYGVNL